MTTDAGFGPDDVPALGPETDAGTGQGATEGAATADGETDRLEDVDGEDGTLSAENEPLGGTGGIGGGGAG